MTRARIAALALLTLPPRDDVASWTADLGSGDPVKQDLARRHVFAHGESVLDALVRAVTPEAPRAAASALALLAAMAPERATPLLEAETRAQVPSPVRAAAATVFAAGDAWATALGAAFLGDEDATVPIALLEGLAARELPARRRFAARFGAELEKLIDRGDPRARRLALRLLVLDDAPAAGERMRALFAGLSADERRRVSSDLLARPPRWSDELLKELARMNADDLAAEDPVPRLLALHLRVRFDPEFRAAIDDDALLDLLRFAGHAAGPAEEHAEAALAQLGPAVAPRLAPLLRRLDDEDAFTLALGPFLRLRGEAGLDELVALLRTPGLESLAGRPILALLARCPCEGTAALLESRIAPGLAPSLRIALLDAALHMPAGAARRRMLVAALAELDGEPRRRAFDTLAREVDPALLPELTRTLLAEPIARLRSRMTTQLAASFGKRQPQAMLTLLQKLLDGEESDRLAALEAIPFVDLGDREAAVVADLVRRFGESAPEPLLHALAQLDGEAAQEAFVALAPRLRDDRGAENGYRFLLARASSQGGAPARALLVAALDDERAAIRESALRALVERADPIAIERAPAVLASLPPLARETLLSELGALRELPGYGALVRGLLDEVGETSARLSLLELAEPPLREVLEPTAIAILHDSESLDERIAALEALARLGGEEGRALLEARVVAAFALEDASFGEEEAAFSEGRAALLQLSLLEPQRQTPRVATMLLRLDAVHARERAARDALGLRDDSPQPDPALLAALAARPADESVAALDAAWRALGDAADLGDERYFSACARSVAASGAAPELCDWFDERVLRLWPASSDADFRALLPPGWRRELLRTHAFEELDAAFLDDARAIAASFRSGDREAEEALGGSDLLLGVTPARTLAVVTTLASERDADGLPSTAAIAAAAREALESPPLLRGVARLAARRHLEVRELGPDAVARLAAAAPLEDELLALQRALESSKR